MPILYLILVTLVLWTAPCLAAIHINEALSSNIDGITDLDGDTPDWLELYNSGPVGVDLVQCGLSDDEANPFRWIFPPCNLEPGEYLLVFASGKNLFGDELHTNFKISASGETLLLTGSGGELLDSVHLVALPVDISLGRSPDGEVTWRYFTEPTPGGGNTTTPYEGFATQPEISVDSGFFSAPFQVEVTDTSGQLDQITWTLEGWDPTESDTPATGPLQMTGTAILRARGFRDGRIPSPIVTRTYLFDESSDLPIVSLVTDPDNLWHVDTGIYVLGDNYNLDPPNWGANFWEDWERPAHLEFFDTTPDAGFALDLGIKIHGGWSRALPQKSLRCVSRVSYGTEAIEYLLFPELPFQEFRTLILRNAGNEWGHTHMRDALIHEIVRGLGVDIQDYRPAALFLNGEYWGIHNIRERLDEHYLESHHCVDPDEVDILKVPEEILAGSDEHYIAMLDFIENNNLSIPANYAYIQTQMDTENFATYEIFEIYFGNRDWPGNNVQYWRSHEGDDRWRWQFYDLDYGLGHHSWPAHNTLEFALEENGPSWPNPPWATFLLRHLVTNPNFLRDFVNRYCDYLNSVLLPESIDPHALRLEQGIETEIPRHMERWDLYLPNWFSELEVMHEFIDTRTTYAREHLREEFGFPGTYALDLSLTPRDGGRIALTALEIDEDWRGVYMRGNPVRLEAIPNPDYLFLGWSDPELPDTSVVWIDPEASTYRLTAEFVEGGSPAGQVVINEINYNSASEFNPGDWVELHNPGEASINIAGWSFKDGDDGHVFTFPLNTVIPARDFLVLCVSQELFTAAFPEVTNVLGDTGFGFSGGGEALRLFDGTCGLYDMVVYDDSPPWPPEPDGNGPTLELIHPLLDNSLAASWAASEASAPYGTPGAINSVVLPTPVAETTPVFYFAAPWPNPFNPATHISFNIPSAGHISLRVYDVAGRQVATIVDQRLSTGLHTLSWRPTDQGSGLYLARLRYGDETITRRLILLK